MHGVDDAHLAAHRLTQEDGCMDEDVSNYLITLYCGDIAIIYYWNFLIRIRIISISKYISYK